MRRKKARKSVVEVCTSVREGIHGIMMIPKEALDTQPKIEQNMKADVAPPQFLLCTR